MRFVRRVQRRISYATALLLTLAFPLTGAAEPGDERRNRDTAVLNFEPTAMLANEPPPGWPTASSPWPPNGTNGAIKGLAATGRMDIKVMGGQTYLHFAVRGARLNTLYTIWTVFKPLLWCADPKFGCPEAFSPPGRIAPGFTDFAGPLKFYPEGGLVAPTASMSKAFTSGMGLDPGATFFTDHNGNGEMTIQLDYNLLGTTYNDGPPVANADVVAQCAVPGVPLTYTSAKTGPTACPSVTIMVNGRPVTAAPTTPRFTVTSSWLRKFVIQTDDPVAECANYDPADPTSIFWQCIDPSTVDRRTGTGLPRVWRYPFDHFRLAAHPDELTHGFIGGSAFEHAIDMVGRRCRLQPLPAGETACP